MKRLPFYDCDMIKAHQQCCKDIVKTRFDKIGDKINKKFGKNSKCREYFDFIKMFVDGFGGYVAGPDALEQFINALEDQYYLQRPTKNLPQYVKKVNVLLIPVFNYAAFCKRKGLIAKNKELKRGGGVTLMRDILRRIRYCPYCNAELVYSMEIDKGHRYKSAFDHFYPQSRYPFLAISLYNLIPCCDRCNSKFKGDKYEETWNTFQPYRDDVDANAEFILNNYTYEMWKQGMLPDFELKKDGASVGTRQTTDKQVIELLPKGSTEETKKRLVNYKKLFRIDDVYSILYSHEALKVLQQAKLLSPEHVKNINGLLSSAKIENIDPWELFVGTPLNRSRINQFHLAKMKLDLLKSYCGVEIQEN